MKTISCLVTESYNWPIQCKVVTSGDVKDVYIQPKQISVNPLFVIFVNCCYTSNKVGVIITYTIASKSYPNWYNVRLNTPHS